MILSWPVLVVAAIFFAAWMKPALPNGEWFQVHYITIYGMNKLLLSSHVCVCVCLCVCVCCSFTEPSC